jgi:hypothetical protein
VISVRGRSQGVNIEVMRLSARQHRRKRSFRLAAMSILTTACKTPPLGRSAQSNGTRA